MPAGWPSRHRVTVVAERRAVFDASPGRVWDLLASPAAWSLYPVEGAAFDVPPPAGMGRLLVGLGVNEQYGTVGVDVFEVIDERPGEWQRMVIRKEGESQADRGLRVKPVGRGAEVIIWHRFVLDLEAPRWAARLARRDAAAQQGALLATWLRACGEVLAGNRPWPADGVPASLLTRFPRPAPGGERDTVSASAVIAAAPDAVWDSVWDPATLVGVEGSGLLAAGHVPGTPQRREGEAQYFIDRAPDGRLAAQLIVVRECAEGHRALVQSLTAVLMDEVLHLVEPAENGTRLTLTYSWDRPSPDVRQARQREAELNVARYKTRIEGAQGASE